ncbi:MAG: hypothetical protein WCS52_01910 [bacterium]
MKWFTVAHVESFRGKRPAEFLDEILKHKGDGPIFGIMDDDYAHIRKTHLNEPLQSPSLDTMNFEELCALIETLPEPAKSSGQVIANAKRIRISKAECSPCEMSKAETALREWLKTN